MSTKQQVSDYVTSQKISNDQVDLGTSFPYLERPEVVSIATYEQLIIDAQNFGITLQLNPPDLEGARQMRGFIETTRSGASPKVAQVVASISLEDLAVASYDGMTSSRAAIIDAILDTAHSLGLELTATEGYEAMCAFVPSFAIDPTWAFYHRLKI